MAINSVSYTPSSVGNLLTDLTSQYNDKTTQLATGRVSPTYGGLGESRSLSLSLTQSLTSIESYQTSISTASLRLEVMSLSLERMEAIRIEAKDTVDQNDYEVTREGKTTTQTTAKIALDEILNLLNSEVAGYHLFGGGHTSDTPVLDLDTILNGNTTQDGLLAVMEEYQLANLGALGNGRLTTSIAADVVTLTEDGAHDFGFDLAGVTSNLTNVTVTGPAGVDPDTIDVDFTGQPIEGEVISFELTLPNGSTTTVELTATDDPGLQGGFVIGATANDTAVNFQNALNTALEESAQSTLKAASDLIAGNTFFDTFQGKEPLRVDGPPFETATTTSANATDTISWYVGDNTSGDPREDSRAAIDKNLTVSYGARANEGAFASMIESLAVFIAADFSAGDAQAESYYTALSSRANDQLVAKNDISGVATVAMEISAAYQTMDYTESRHQTIKVSYESQISDIEGIDQQRTAAELLQLETQVQASYRATSIMLNLTLADYL
ncbi:MAG: flagellar protein [Stappiaceae bacterium]